jgi:hypothetical protein
LVKSLDFPTQFCDKLSTTNKICNNCKSVRTKGAKI